MIIITKYNKDPNHTIYRNSKNEEVPSATTLLKILNKPSLVQWANYLGFKRLRVDDVLEEYAELGTLIHLLISSYLNKDMIVYIPQSNIPNNVVFSYFAKFKKWYSKHDVEPIYLEQSFSSDKFGGTVDFYGKIDGYYTILDFKTSKKIRLSMMIQLALYCILLEQHGCTVDRVGILLVNPDYEDEKYISRKELDPYIEFALQLVDIFHSYYYLNEYNNWNEYIL